MAVRFFLFVIFFLSTFAFAEEFTLPPIVKEVSPVDALNQDPVIPAKKASVELSTGNGSVVQTMVETLAYPVTDPGRAGGLNQFRGLGVSSEDTSVESLGIPLNYPQGGGFDFSTFPQFFWSSFKFQQTPSVGGLDPRGVSGTVSLVPWSAAALTSASEVPGDSKTRLTGMYSDADLVQLSIGTKVENRVALVAGTSSGQVNGPTGSLSSLLIDENDLKLKFHLLATDVDENLYNFGSPEPADMRTIRTIPVLQADWVPDPEWVFKGSIFYDNTYERYDNFATPASFTRDRAQQYGIETALLHDDWKLGVGARHVYYVINGAFNAEETITHAALGKTLTYTNGSDSRFIVDPLVQEVSDSGFTAYPEGSVGVRQEWGQDLFALFARESYSRRIPSLADRYYTVVGALANPLLEPETDWTTVAGLEGHSGIWSGQVQGYYQLRDNAQAGVILNDGFTIEQQNVGQARIASLLVDGSVQLMEHATFSDSFTWNRSHSDGLGHGFPFLPDLINIATLAFEPVAKTTVSLIGRTQSDAYGLPSAAFGDLQLDYLWTRDLHLIGRMENFTGESLVLYPGYPPKGRVLSVAAVGAL